ncbi:MAG: hypothetical protein AAGJ34_04220 [Pseudomonadota bacterium]
MLLVLGLWFGLGPSIAQSDDGPSRLLLKATYISSDKQTLEFEVLSPSPKICAYFLEQSVIGQDVEPVPVGLEVEVLTTFGDVVRPFSNSASFGGFDVPSIKIRELPDHIVAYSFPTATTVFEYGQKIRIRGFYFPCPLGFEERSASSVSFENSGGELDAIGYRQIRFVSPWLVNQGGVWIELE